MNGDQFILYTVCTLGSLLGYVWGYLKPNPLKLRAHQKNLAFPTTVNPNPIDLVGSAEPRIAK